MKFITVKSDRTNEITKQTGVTFTWVDGSLKRVRIPVGESFVEVTLESYQLAITEPAPPEMVSVVRVLGLVAGIPLSEYFHDKSDAEQRISDFRSRVEPAFVRLSIEIVKVTNDEADRLLANSNGAPASVEVDISEEIPF